MLLWGVEEDVTLHLHSLEMPLHSCFFPVPPPGPWIKAASDTPRAQAERRDAFPGRRKEESSHIQLGCSRQAQSHVLPSISSSPARTVTPMVQGWGGERGFPRPRLCPTAAQRQAAGKLGGCRGAGGRAHGTGDSWWAQPDQRHSARARLNNQQLLGKQFAVWESPRLAPALSAVPERCIQAETGTLVYLHSGPDSSEEQVGLADVLHSGSCPGHDQIGRDTALCEDRLLGPLLSPQPSCAAAAFEPKSFRQGALARSKGKGPERRVEGGGDAFCKGSCSRPVSGCSFQHATTVPQVP